MDKKNNCQRKILNFEIQFHNIWSLKQTSDPPFIYDHKLKDWKP